MDNEATAMRQQMDDTMDGLTDKLGELGHQVSGTVRTVKDSMNTVRDTFDLRLQVRRRPWTIMAGATALGFLWGSRSSNCGTGCPVQNGRSASAPLAHAAAAEHPCTGANVGVTNGVDAVRLSAAAAPSWLANLGATLQPEITALRGLAVGALFEVVREIIVRQAPKPMKRSVGDANNDSSDRPEGSGRSRSPRSDTPEG